MPGTHKERHKHTVTKKSIRLTRPRRILPFPNNCSPSSFESSLLEPKVLARGFPAWRVAKGHTRFAVEVV